MALLTKDEVSLARVIHGVSNQGRYSVKVMVISLIFDYLADTGIA